MDYVICGRNHLPNGMLLPLANHTEVVWRIHDQIAVSKPVRKQLWKQIVAAKVRGQAANLEPGSAVQRRLLALAREVKSGDPTNVEAQAAKIRLARLKGYEGDPCSECGQLTLVRSGACCKCDTCGASSGCS